LSGIRVLDLSRVLAGPWSTQIFADFGADVIKIERPGAGDETRMAGPPFLRDRDGRDTADAAYYLSANRGKKSVAVNIATPEGQEIIRKLAAASDILVENYRVGTLEKYGLSYDQLREINPRLIYCSITGFGQTGPYRDRAGYDFVFQAMGGLMSITGEKDGSPQKVGVAVADIMTGLYATIAVLGALAHRSRTGSGQFIDMSLLDVQVAALANMNLNYFCSGQTPPRMGNAHANLVPYQAFCCSDGDIVVAAGNNNHFQKLCRALGIPDLAKDERFSSNPGRVRNRDALIVILDDLFAKLTKEACVKRLEEFEVPCAPINTIPQVFEEPQVKARKLKIEVEHPLAGPIPLVANPIRFSESQMSYKAPPLLAEHTDQVLGGLLNLSSEQLLDLADRGIIQRPATAKSAAA
jgi:crotonobetainyl-CoA:carnitine CoA-transferase CaiB-like acyl-CoA transferase